MKRFAFPAFVIIVLAGCAAFWYSLYLSESPAPDLLLAKAIEAHGGAANITKPRAGTLKAVSDVNGDILVQQDTFDLPLRWKRQNDETLAGINRVHFYKNVGAKYWQWDKGMPPREVEKDGKIRHYFAALFDLVELRHGDAKPLPLKRTMLDRRPVVGFRVGVGESAADYLFDEQTNLLAQTRATHGGIDTQTGFSDYRTIDGVQLPCRRTIRIKNAAMKDYTLILDHVISEVQIVASLPEDTFALPKAK